MDLCLQSSSMCVIVSGGGDTPVVSNERKGGIPLQPTIPVDSYNKKTTNQLLIPVTIPVKQKKKVSKKKSFQLEDP